MDVDEALRQLDAIVDGIDRAEIDDGDGWWPSSEGCEFGRERRRLLVELVRALTVHPAGRDDRAPQS